MNLIYFFCIKRFILLHQKIYPYSSFPEAFHNHFPMNLIISAQRNQLIPVLKLQCSFSWRSRKVTALSKQQQNLWKNCWKGKCYGKVFTLIRNFTKTGTLHGDFSRISKNDFSGLFYAEQLYSKTHPEFCFKTTSVR